MNQCFGFTYELSWKMLKRHLEATQANPADLDLATFQGLIRLGNEGGLLISDWTTWKTYRLAGGVRRILASELPGLEVWAFGSRARHTASPTRIWTWQSSRRSPCRWHS